MTTLPGALTDPPKAQVKGKKAHAASKKKKGGKKGKKSKK